MIVVVIHGTCCNPATVTCAVTRTFQARVYEYGRIRGALLGSTAKEKREEGMGGRGHE